MSKFENAQRRWIAVWERADACLRLQHILSHITVVCTVDPQMAWKIPWSQCVCPGSASCDYFAVF